MDDPRPPKWESKWHNVVRELVGTERNYVRQLEVQSVRLPILRFCTTLTLFQEYASTLSRSNSSLAQQLFPDIAELMQFQHDLSTRFDTTLLSLPCEQDWGRHFVETVSSSNIQSTRVLAPNFQRKLNSDLYTNRTQRPMLWLQRFSQNIKKH